MITNEELEKVLAITKLQPCDWELIQGIKIIDPDGWRGINGKSFEEPITRAEWEERKNESTINPLAFRHSVLKNS